ncbi:MAG: ATP-binding cassette domain-containing protein [Chloroflexota bacterium]|nr:ATP-binding cassette domain-containing protein [Chloroflexota bacterium]
MTTIQVKNLTQRFGKREVLHGIDLEVGHGVFGLLGPNGAGKTTLLRTLATLLEPSGGRVRLLGYDPGVAEERRALRRRLGYLPQQFGYDGSFTVREFVEYMALLKEVATDAVDAAVASAIERVGLAERADERLGKLSGGMVRRAGIAQAIVNAPELLLLDEPTAGLDPQQRVTFRALLREVGAECTVVVSTHLVEDVATACTEVALMDEGRLLFRGTPADLVARGEGFPLGDTPIERGYGAVMATGQP